jgi:uncharacterized protein YyaL (SSP411 family)/aryl-alcohol dehydrogenase-like predicted oxidoreductase
MSQHAARRHENRLARSTSPYLLQHAHNPVDWYPWGEEALARARAEDKPILLSIGYSACHWCHVMAHESFEDEAIAERMNRDFVCVKVDREERPDLDDIYMAATLAMNHGQGGWPMTVFLTPEQEPFFAGTYFPPTDRHGRPGFPSLLEKIAGLWKTDREGLRSQAGEVAAYLREGVRSAPGGSLGEAELRAARDQLDQDFDARFGGFGGAPKFPPSGALSLLLRCHRRFHDERALEMARKTLDEMARGGMYDQLAGGFHRYSVDEQWLVPHFEKMLYDNAQLAKVYLEGHQATGDPFYRKVAVEILDYVLGEMTSPEGGFYSATDADSEGEEGRFFVWTPDEVGAALGDEEAARRFCAYYDVSERGNWEGKSILNTSRTGSRVAQSLGMDVAGLESAVAASKARLYEARSKRVPPGLDDKVLTAWNGLMIGALAEGHRVLGDRRYLEAAERAAAFVTTRLRADDGRLLRTYREGQAHLAAYLEDYAYLAEGLLDLYESGGDVRWLRTAESLAERTHEDFGDEAGGFYSTARGHEALIVRHREGHDGATPNANAVAAHVLARLSFHLDRDDLREETARAIRAYGKAIARQPRAFARSLAVADLLLGGPVELAFVGAEGAADLEALRREVGRHYLPNRIVAHGGTGAADAGLPLLTGKGLVGGRAALYVCRAFACRAPITDPAAIADALSEQAAASASEGGTLSGRRLPSAASAESTASYAARMRAAGQSEGYGPLGTTGLTCSRVGFGGYRVDDETPPHREALRRALLEGCNLVDTSTNYTEGGSERLIGEVLAELAGSGRLPRGEVVIVSKIGYVQGQNLERATEREASGQPYPEMVKYAEGVWHCIHPEFLEDQLARSLERLGLETLDVCLLHNPEYYLSDAHERSHGTLEKRREEFYRRLTEAFRFLEGAAAAGRIRWYGVSSNTCTRPANDAEATSLTRMLEAARQAGGAGHRFRVLQLPMNLFEPGAALERNNGAGLDQTVLEFAAAQGVGVLVNRPLNAMAGEGMVRLADVPEAEPAEGSLDDHLATLASLEAEFRRDIAARLQVPEGATPPQMFFRWSADLKGAEAHVRTLEQWSQVETYRILPRLAQAIRALDQALAGPIADQWRDWRARYVPELRAALDAMRARAAAHSRAVSRTVSAALDTLLPPGRRAETLSRKALWVAGSTGGVSSVLVGMRAPAYVDDALAILAWPPLPDAARVYVAMRDVALPA